MQKDYLQTLKGFRDFLPSEAKKRQYLIKKFVETFELFGFDPLETPTLEYQELLLGKYGNDADKLVYKFTDEGGRNVALRYDQTVPTARVLATYNQQLPMPWRRYQIQNTFRAEKPQKGRFREFLQCDADIYGSTSPLADAEIIALSSKIYENFGFKNFKIYVNDRRILFNLTKYANIPDNLVFQTISAIDKLDRKDKEEVITELLSLGLDKDRIDHLFHHLDEAEETDFLKDVISYSKSLGVKGENILFQARLARGLDYYTGTIFEIKVDEYTSGSVLGGGRYDKLIENLSGIDVPAVGFAVGFDRTYEALENLKLFPDILQKTSSSVLVSIFSKETSQESFEVVNKLRENGINSEVYPSQDTKLDKQLKYADKKQIKWFIVIGPDELKRNKLILKDLQTGRQEDIRFNELLKKVAVK